MEEQSAVRLLTEILRTFNNFTERVNGLAEDVRGLRHLKPEFRELKEIVMGFKEQVTELKTRLDTVESTLTAEAAEIKAIVAALEARVAEIEGLDLTPELNRLSNIASNISGLSDAVAAPTPDQEVPTTPGQPSASNLTATSVDLAWSPSTDNVGIASYEVYANGASLMTASGPSASIGGLTPETNYVFSVCAVDNAGNKSAMSPETIVDTPAASA